MAPLTGAERQRRYRQKLRQENPGKLMQQKRENLERTKEKYKKISELNESQQNLQREKWRKVKQKNKDEEIDSKILEGKKEKSNQRMYFRKLQKENFNLKSTVALLVKKAKILNRKNNRYKKKIEQLTQKIVTLNSSEQEEKISHKEEFEENKDTPYSKTEIMMKEIVPEISTPEKNTVKKILFENLLIKESLQNQYSQATNNSEREILKKIVNNDMTAKYNMKTKLSSFTGLKGRLRVRQKINKYKIKRLKELVTFFERDDNSRSTAGKNEYRTFKKTRKQIRYLLDSVKNLHKKYKKEGGTLSYSTFNRYKPFYVLSPKITDRNTCACVKHANLKFLANKLKQLRLIKIDNLTELVSTIACNIEDKKCMYNECNLCSSKSVVFDLSQSISNRKTDMVSWNMWVTKRFKYSKNTINQQSQEKITQRTVKEEIKGTLETLKQTFCTQLRLFKKHHFNIMHQFKMYTNCKNKLTDREIVVHCDFSENFICKFTEEIQAMHFGASKRQVTLHTGVIYAKSHEKSQTISFCTISKNNNHTPGAIWAHLTPVLKFIQEKFPAVKTIHFFTDGPTSQYRQKKNFYMMNTVLTQLGFEKATWSFFEASHGKGAADGVGGATKRSLDRYVVHGYDIPDAKAAYNILVKNNTSKINYFLVPDEDIENSIKMLDAISKNLIAVPETLSIHQVASTPNTQIIKFRKLSCFCGEDFGFCDCFDLTEHNLNQKRKIIMRATNTNKKRRQNSSNKQQAKDSDTDTDMDISYAESDNSMYEIEQLDSDNIEDNEEIIMSMEDKTVDRKCKGTTNITQGSDDMESIGLTKLVEDNKFINISKIKENKKVKILSDIKLSLENQAFPKLQDYGPFKIIDKNSNLFTSHCNKENVKNIYDDAVPSTSGIKQKKNNIKTNSEREKIVIKKTVFDEYNTDLRNINKEAEQKLEDSTDTHEINEEVSYGNDEIKKNTEGIIIYNFNLALPGTGLGQNTNMGEQDTEKNNEVDIQNNSNDNVKLQEKIEEAKAANFDDSNLLFHENESVLVRYFEKNKWMYYVGFVESVQYINLERFCTIRFLKTVRKPKLKFVYPKKDDKDTVPNINVVKKIHLKQESKEYVLSEDSDSVYFI